MALEDNLFTILCTIQSGLVFSYVIPLSFFLSTFFILFIVSLDAKIDKNKLVQKKFTLLISKVFMNVFFSSFIVFHTVLQRFCLVNSCH